MAYRKQPKEIAPVEERLLSTGEVAKLLGLHPITLAKWRSVGRFRNELPHISLGLRVRYRQADVLAFMQRGVQ